MRGQHARLARDRNQERDRPAPDIGALAKTDVVDDTWTAPKEAAVRASPCWKRKRSSKALRSSTSEDWVERRNLAVLRELTRDIRTGRTIACIFHASNCDFQHCTQPCSHCSEYLTIVGGATLDKRWATKCEKENNLGRACITIFLECHRSRVSSVLTHP